jgi:hypothetical protein
MGPARVFCLNPLMDLPSRHASGSCDGDETADLYFLDLDPYRDPGKTNGCLERLAREVSARRLDLAAKTLLLSARGLDPLGRELLALLRQFGAHHLFYEAWNQASELVDLLEGGVESLYFLPVTSNLTFRPTAPTLTVPPSARVAVKPNRQIFVSLGGDDDLDVIRGVVARCPDLRFFVPTVTWVKGPTRERRYLEVRIPAPNVTPVDCSTSLREQSPAFSQDYLKTYGGCDTVLVANVPAKRHQMRGGVRVADALQARKQLVLVENPMCQLIMARHGATCLVAEPTVESVAAHLTRICEGGFQVDEGVYEEIRSLTFDAGKLSWILEAGREPERARRSVFACTRERLAREIELLGDFVTSVDPYGGRVSTSPGARPPPGSSPPPKAEPLAALFDLAVGKPVPSRGGPFVVQRIVAEGPSAYRVDCEQPGTGAGVTVLIVTVPTEAYAYRTRRGHYLVCVGTVQTEPAREALRRIAELC